MRHVIINADDFGLSPSINQSIVRAYDLEALTSTTLLVSREATRAAVELAATRPDMRIGLHLDLDRFFCFETNGHFGITIDDIDRAEYDWVVSHRMDLVSQEIARQLDQFFSLGLQPTHLDGHHNIHLMPDILPEVVRILSGYDLKRIRFAHRFYAGYKNTYTAQKHILDAAGFRYPDQCIEIDEFLPLGVVFDNLEQGVSEVIVHTELPGVPGDQWRVDQFLYVISPDTREHITRLDIKKASYAELESCDDRG